MIGVMICFCCYRATKVSKLFEGMQKKIVKKDYPELPVDV